MIFISVYRRESLYPEGYSTESELLSMSNKRVFIEESWNVEFLHTYAGLAYKDLLKFAQRIVKFINVPLIYLSHV